MTIFLSDSRISLKTNSVHWISLFDLPAPVKSVQLCVMQKRPKKYEAMAKMTIGKLNIFELAEVRVIPDYPHSAVFL